MPKPTRFVNFKRPALQQPLAQIEIEGLRLDLHQQLRLVGLTYGIVPTTATLGWAAVEPVVVIREGQAIPVSGFALHCDELTRFEASFQSDPPGELEYFELRHDPELTWVFFFEGGTIRLSGEEFRAELITESEDDDAAEGHPPEPGGMVQ